MTTKEKKPYRDSSWLDKWRTPHLGDFWVETAHRKVGCRLCSEAILKGEKMMVDWNGCKFHIHHLSDKDKKLLVLESL